MIHTIAKRFTGFSWRWNHLLDFNRKPVLVIHDASQRVLVDQLWHSLGQVSFDWAGNTPWLDRELPREPLPVDAPELAQLLDYVVGDYEQAMVLLLYGHAPAQGNGLLAYLRKVRAAAGGARVVYANRGNDRMSVQGYAADAGVEYLDCGDMTEDACIGLLAKLLSDQIQAAGEPLRQDPWVREPAEWTHVSFDESQDDLPRVLLVGDSISNGYGDTVRELLDGKFSVDQLQTSEGTACPKYIRMLEFMLDRRQYSAVHWNVGLHLHGVTPQHYEQQLQILVEHIQRPGVANIVFATSTPTHRVDDVSAVDWEETNRFIEYNQRAATMCARLGVAVDDLYTVAVQNHLPMVDRHHFTQAGYERLAQAVVQSIREVV